MKIKTLAIAAATLAVGAITSQAQVYSQNIVGYVNIVTQPGVQTLICNPLDLDGVDNITNVLAGAPKGVAVQLWNGAGYTAVGRGSFGVGAWTANAATNFIPPGTGFFIQTPGLWTNTFTGTMIPAVGGTNSLALTGGMLQLVGSVLPVSGTVTNAADQGPGTLNLANLPKGVALQFWNGAGFTAVGRGSFGVGAWTTNYTVNVGQGFFIKSPTTTNWVQVYTNN
jgi:hypothetical protein